MCCEQNKSLAEFIKLLMKSLATSLYSRNTQDLNELLQNKCYKMNILLHFCSIFYIGRLNFWNYYIDKIVLLLIYIYFTLGFWRIKLFHFSDIKINRTQFNLYRS